MISEYRRAHDEYRTLIVKLNKKYSPYGIYVADYGAAITENEKVICDIDEM